MVDDPVPTLLLSSDIYRRARDGILRVSSGAQAGELIELLTTCVRSAYVVGRSDERQRHQPAAVPLTTLDGMLPQPCCCTHASGRHCRDCHGEGHADLARLASAA